MTAASTPPDNRETGSVHQTDRPASAGPAPALPAALPETVALPVPSARHLPGCAIIAPASVPPDPPPSSVSSPVGRPDNDQTLAPDVQRAHNVPRARHCADNPPVRQPDPAAPAASSTTTVACNGMPGSAVPHAAAPRQRQQETASADWHTPRPAWPHTCAASAPFRHVVRLPGRPPGACAAVPPRPAARPTPPADYCGIPKAWPALSRGVGCAAPRNV